MAHPPPFRLLEPTPAAVDPCIAMGFLVDCWLVGPAGGWGSLPRVHIPFVLCISEML